MGKGMRSSVGACAARHFRTQAPGCLPLDAPSGAPGPHRLVGCLRARLASMAATTAGKRQGNDISATAGHLEAPGRAAQAAPGGARRGDAGGRGADRRHGLEPVRAAGGRGLSPARLCGQRDRWRRRARGRHGAHAQPGAAFWSTASPGARKAVGVAPLRELHGADGGARRGRRLCAHVGHASRPRRCSSAKAATSSSSTAASLRDLLHAREEKTLPVVIRREGPFLDTTLPPSAWRLRAQPCPLCGGPMIERVLAQGPLAGRRVLGCSHYPLCEGTREVAEGGFDGAAVDTDFRRHDPVAQASASSPRIASICASAEASAFCSASGPIARPSA